MTEIIYFDIDGTLRNECQGITKHTACMIKQCRRKGILTVVCTGRNPGSIQDDVLDLEMDGIISGGGCFISYQGEWLKKTCFSNQEAESLLQEILKLEIAASVETEHTIYMNHRAAEFYKRDYEYKLSDLIVGERSRVRRENKVNYLDNFSQLNQRQEAIHKICILGEKMVIDEFSKTYRKAAKAVQQKEWNGQWYLELLPTGCQKGEAVTFLNQWLGISKDNSMSFGDGSNDLDMLQATGISVAVKNGSPELLDYADSVCEPPEQDGIYKELLRRGII